MSLKTEEGKLQVIELDACGVSHQQISDLSGIPRSTIGDFLRKETFVRWWSEYHDTPIYTGSPPKMVVLDVETAPQMGYFWGRFNQNIGANMVTQNCYMLTWAAKELGDSDVEFDSLFLDQEAYQADPTDDKRIIESMYEVLDDADIIIAHNGDNFDMKKILARGVIHGLTPPVMPRKIDTLKIARRECKFDSNRLDELCKFFGMTGKIDTGGFELWQGCMDGDASSWAKMLKYNIGDIHALEAVYLKLRHYDSKHPNVGQYYRDGKRRCTVCGSAAVVTTGGEVHTNMSIYQSAQCGNCGHQMKLPTNLKTKEEKIVRVLNA